MRTFTADYTAAGQAVGFAADVGSQTGAAAGTDAWDPNVLQVNNPLRLAGERVYLIGHGFTPHFRVTFADGTVRDYAQPFAPDSNDPNFTSQGAVKILDPPGVTGDDVRKHQLAIVGIFAPTATLMHGGIMTRSSPRRETRGWPSTSTGATWVWRAADPSRSSPSTPTRWTRVRWSSRPVEPDAGGVGHPGRRHVHRLHRLQTSGCRCRPRTTPRRDSRWCSR